MKIQPIVEGYGEVSAVPELLRRLLNESQTYELKIGRPIRRKRSELVQETPLRRAVRLSLLQPECSAVLILFDGDDDCPKEVAPMIQNWAVAEAGSVPCAVVMARREYEAWFLATLESLRGKCGIRPDASSHQDPEGPRGAKEVLEGYLFPGRTYSETADQVRLTAAFDMGQAFARCRSFRKMTKAFGELVTAAGFNIRNWPPRAWSEEAINSPL